MAEERRVQVVMSWGGTPHGVVEVRQGMRVVIGDGEDVSFLLPSEHVPEPFALIESGEGTFRARIPAGAVARADRGGEDPLAGTSPESPRILELDPRTRVEIEIGPFVFFVSDAIADATKAPLARPDLQSWRWVAVSLGVHALFLGSLLFMPPNAGALSLDLTGSQREYIQMRLDAMERERIEVAPIPQPESGGAEGQASAGEEGTAGAPEETRHTGGGVRVRGESEDRRVPLTRESAATSSVITTLTSALASFHAVSSPFGAADAAGFADDDAYGALMADASGFGPGTGGLGMVGTGRGGGCRPGEVCGAGTIGVGGLSTGGFGRGSTCTEDEYATIEHTRGHAAAVAACLAGGVGRGELGGTGRVSRRPPQIHCAPGPDGECGEVRGGLAREQIRRVISRNRGQVRHCYEQGLVQRPDLAGRVTVRWMIQPSGAVMGATISTPTDLRSPQVEQCVAQAVGRWQFPASEGATMVSYPFVLQSAE